MSNKDVALGYLRRGLSVIPLYSPAMLKQKPPKKFQQEIQEKLNKNALAGSPKTETEIVSDMVTNKCKTPCIIGWKEFQNRLPTEQEVSGWFDENPDANVAIITGKISNLVVFDLDSQDAVDYAENEGGFPDSVKVKTGKG
jgi:hypothetical protein